MKPTKVTEKKKWKYMCGIGQSIAQYMKKSNYRCVHHPKKEHNDKHK